MKIKKFPILEKTSNKFSVPGRGSGFILQLLLYPEVLAPQFDKLSTRQAERLTI